MKKLFVLLLVSGSALADDSSLLACRQIGADAARLACYDAVPVLTKEQSFGLKKENTEAESIDSFVPGHFEGWEPNQVIQLGNGQRWRIIDGSAGFVYKTDVKVRVEQGALGGKFMLFDGTTNAPKVRRVE